VLAVQVWGRHMSDEELAAIRVRARVSHREDAWLGEFSPVLELVGKRIVNFLSLEIKSTNPFVFRAAPASTSRVTTLNHEIIDDPVESYSVVEFLFGEERKRRDCHRGVVEEVDVNCTLARF